MCRRKKYDTHNLLRFPHRQISSGCAGRGAYRPVDRGTEILFRGLDHMSAQAVGGAVGHNPISIIIPCHRVVGTNGSLTGYAGGMDRKVKLLAQEGVDMGRLFVPQKTVI